MAFTASDMRMTETKRVKNMCGNIILPVRKTDRPARPHISV